MTRCCALAAAGALSVASLSRGEEPARQEAKVAERVRVERVVVSAYVIDRRGAPVLALSPANFRVSVGSAEVPLESVEWVEETAGRTEVAGLETTSVNPAEDSGRGAKKGGRAIVMLFQWEVAAEKARGFLRVQRLALDFLETLPPEDRVAVGIFGSRLWIQQDFTTDKEKAERAIRSVLRTGGSAGGEEGGYSISARLGEEGARAATSIEKALLAIGSALEPLPGQKTILYLGWGLGRWRSLKDKLGCLADEGLGYVEMTGDYGRARAALGRAQAAVFSLDLSDADSHGLGAGLEKLSDDTGGFSMKTHLFPELAFRKVGRATSGHYVLVFRKPAGPAGTHEIRVALVGARGTVLHRQTYSDSRP